MSLSKQDIEEINRNSPEGQGIFTEPNGIPVYIKGPVIYMRWKTGGMYGGGYTEHSNLRPFESDEPKPPFKVLDLALEILCPNLNYLQYRKIEELKAYKFIL